MLALTMNNFPRAPWTKQAFWTLAAAYPCGYMMIHSWRDVSAYKWLYNRLSGDVPDHLVELVEDELDNMPGVKKAKVSISLTENMNARTFGAFFIENGAEIQLPLRFAIRNGEDARKLGCNIEVDTGLKKSKRKVDIESKLGEKFLSEIVVSDSARRFVIYRELLHANSGKAFVVPIIMWWVSFGLSYFFLVLLVPILGNVAAFASATSIASIVFYKLYTGFKTFLTRKFDAEACERSNLHRKGAEEFFYSSLKLNRLMRKIMGKDGPSYFTEMGDCVNDRIPYSERLSAIKQIGISSQPAHD